MTTAAQQGTTTTAVQPGAVTTAAEPGAATMTAQQGATTTTARRGTATTAAEQHRPAATAAQRGTTTVSDKAVRKIAERAATEVLPGGAARATKGAATVRGRRAEVAVEVPLPYPEPLSDTARRVQDHVARRTAELTGLDLSTPRVGVTALTLPSARGVLRAKSPSSGASLAGAPLTDTSLEGTPSTGTTSTDTLSATAGRTPLRWWSQRRVPMALLTLVAAVGCGALAFDLILVHTGHRPAGTWRMAGLNWLSQHGPSSGAAVAGAVAVAALGVLLIVLAVTPGRRGLLTVTSSAPRLRVAVDRAAIAALVEDAVRDTAGIGPVRVRVGRRRVTVRAGLTFGDRQRARRAVHDAALRVLEGCGLRRAPRLRITVRPEPVWDDGTPPSGQPPTTAPDKKEPDLTKQPTELTQRRAPAPDPKPRLTLGPDTATDAGPTPDPTPPSTPGSTPDPTPTLTPDPKPRPAPGPDTAPDAGPTPGPTPTLTSNPAPRPTPGSTPSPAPRPTPGTAPDLAPRSTPGSDPAPDADPTPARRQTNPPASEGGTL
ncbi:DUF6286 domain-containing protein [Streptomyces sp. NPDC087294]|uniref:DUF6286 domain-containing protein n=1 Tax=Streptomyces sp. NPDC087294 TaxID=3365777 RepID=UPI00382349E8